MEIYVPPFTISNKMLELVGSIMEKVGKLDNFSNLTSSLSDKFLASVNLPSITSKCK